MPACTLIGKISTSMCASRGTYRMSRCASGTSTATMTAARPANASASRSVCRRNPAASPRPASRDTRGTSSPIIAVTKFCAGCSSVVCPARR